MMLADPDFVIVQIIKELDEFQITAKRQRGILIKLMMRPQKGAKLQRAGLREQPSARCHRIAENAEAFHLHFDFVTGRQVLPQEETHTSTGAGGDDIAGTECQLPGQMSDLFNNAEHHLCTTRSCFKIPLIQVWQSGFECLQPRKRVIQAPWEPKSKLLRSNQSVPKANPPAHMVLSR